MNKKKEIDRGELYKLYVEDKLLLKDIQKIFNVSRQTLNKRLIEYEINKRKKKEVFEISKEELYDLYVNKNMTTFEIAEMKKTTRGTIEKRLRKYDIKKPKELFYKKNKELLKERYGVENVSQLKDVKEKKRQKAIKKYGVENISQSKEIKSKKEKKALEKFGVPNVLQSEEVKKKCKETILEKYGVDNINKVREIREKSKKTMLEKYGVEYPGQSEVLKDKMKQTNLKKYGAKYVFQSEKIKEKIRQTNLKRYGNKNNFSNPIIKEKIKQTCLEKYGVPYACMREECRRANKGAISKINRDFAKRLKNLQIKNKLEYNIENFSYDIFILNSNIVIEINPTYTHNATLGSEFRGHKKALLTEEYHYNKTKTAKENGYRCIHVFDWDSQEKIINMLKPKEKLYARNLDCKEIEQEEATDFLEKYHLQGSCRGQKVRIGLFYNDELVEIMTFGKPRYNKKYEWELLRLCSHSDYNIIGGANKLFTHFLIDYNPQTIISYCDNSKFDGDVYKVLGFKLLDYGKPSKHWYNMKTKQHITDNLLRQRGFDQLFKTNYGKGISNRDLMIENGFVEVYDSGQSIYLFEK